MNKTTLQGIAKSITVAKAEVVNTEMAWDTYAENHCRYCQGAECAYIGEGSSDDPFCYADNCPILQGHVEV